MKEWIGLAIENLVRAKVFIDKKSRVLYGEHHGFLSSRNPANKRMHFLTSLVSFPHRLTNFSRSGLVIRILPPKVLFSAFLGEKCGRFKSCTAH